MKVYRAEAIGLDTTYFIIAAESVEEAHKIAVDQDYGNVSLDDLWELTQLQTTETVSGVIEQL